MKMTLIAALLLSTLLSGGALASDATDSPVPSATSFYVGAQIGGASADVTDTEYEVASSTPSDYTWDGDDTALLGGVYLGFNYMATETLLIGVEGDLGYASLGDKHTYDELGVPEPDYLLDWESGLQGSVRARAGMTAGKALIYATGGIAIGQQSFKFYEYQSDTVFEDFNRTMMGWTAGLGAEYAFMTNWTARLEYRYTDFGGVKIIPTVYDFDSEYEDRIDVTQQSVMAGAAYHF
jgi:outer membrane immunogenic protein